MPKQRLFKYYPEDFGKLPIRVLHMDLDFDVQATQTTVVSHFTAQALEEPISRLAIDAKNLRILSVKCDQTPVTSRYDKKNNKLIVRFKKKLTPHQEFTITTKTICKPTKNTLEGLYYDETPKGAPPTQITQCQQWGFQRLVPCVDDMTAKCTYNTTITADKRYTNFITNGDVVQQKKPVGKNRVRIKYKNTTTPMAPYLFFLGVGTYATSKRTFEYPDGTTFTLELLAPYKSDKDAARNALDVLHDAIMWIYIFTGPDKYKHMKERRKLLQLIEKREQLKEQGKNITFVRKKIEKLASKLTFGYKYTGTVYREIAMQNSDFGGMENVGNTTITANRIMPFKEMTDNGFEYMIIVKVHEFYHNLNGSEVTGWSPFEIWLNEAVTVHIEKEYHAFLFGETYSRLEDVLTLLGGTFIQDDSASSMPIEPEGFNDTNELITSITYVKAPEVVRMIQMLLGKEIFVQGLDLYHTRYKHGNATRKQWVEAMEDASQFTLQPMAQTWLKTTGYPKIKAYCSYNKKNKTYTIKLTQTNAKKGKHWEFPFDVALLDKNGKVLAHELVHVKQPQQTITFENIQEPAFPSLNRNYSFYGKVQHNMTKEQLYLQTQKDTDFINRYMAFYHLMDEEKMKLLKNPKEHVNNNLINLYWELFTNKHLMEEAGGALLSIFEHVEDEAYAHRYKALYDVRKKILTTIAQKYEKQLLKLYQQYAAKKAQGTYTQQQVANIKNRQLKNLCLGLLAKIDKPYIHNLIKHQFTTATCATDKNIAFLHYINSSAEDKVSFIKDYEREAKKSLVSWEVFLSIIAGNDSDDALEIMQRIEQSPSFRIEQANDQRALYLGFALNKKRSLQTEEGRKYLQEILIKLAPINEYTTVGIVKVFGHIDKMEKEYHTPLVQLLLNIMKTLKKDKTPSVYNTIKRMLINMPKATKTYEQETKRRIIMLKQ